jgi:hypothetical protein
MSPHNGDALCNSSELQEGIDPETRAEAVLTLHTSIVKGIGAERPAAA